LDEFAEKCVVVGVDGAVLSVGAGSAALLSLFVTLLSEVESVFCELLCELRWVAGV
jgi:hypothetical protein